MWLFVPGMSFPSVPDTEDSSSPFDLLAPEFDLWVLASGKPTLLPSSEVEWRKMPWIRVLSGTIWRPSRAHSIATAWISSLPAFPAKAPASPDADAASTTSGGSGPKSGASRKRSARVGSSSRTSRVSSRLTGAKRSRKSSGTWQRAGGLRSGTVSPRPPWAPRTRGTASSCSLPTPSASQYGSSQNGVNGRGGERERPSAGTPSLQTRARRGELLPTPQASDMKRANTDTVRASTKSGKRLSTQASVMLPTPTTNPQAPNSGSNQVNGPTSLLEAARQLPTPMASDSRRTLTQADRERTQGPTLHEAINRLAQRGTLPTPTAMDAKSSGVAGNWTAQSGRHAGATLTDVAVREIDLGSSTPGAATGNGATRLNPRFVEWMMGLPPGWTMVPTQTNSTSWATVSSRTRQRSRSPSSGSDSTDQLNLFPVTNEK